MATKWTTRRPSMRLYGSWEGDNLAELEAAFPNWTFSVNTNGTLAARSESGEFNWNVPVGYWFTEDGSSPSDPTLGNEVQEAPTPGLVAFNLSLD